MHGAWHGNSTIHHFGGRLLVNLQRCETYSVWQDIEILLGTHYEAHYKIENHCSYKWTSSWLRFVCSTPRRTSTQVLQGIPHTQCILDDIIITGSSAEDHKRYLSQVLSWLAEHGLRDNFTKYEFFEKRVSYCGHKIDEKGLHKYPAKITAVTEVPRPENVTQLRAFHGLVNYYHRFIPNYSTVVPFEWTLPGQVEMEMDRFTRSCIQEGERHAGFWTSVMPLQPIFSFKTRMWCIPIWHWLCVISFFGGSERPIAYASIILKKAEREYLQIDKKALSIYLGIQKFNTYLFGKTFHAQQRPQAITICIFNQLKALPAKTAAQLQRYAVSISGYSYDIIFKSTHKHCNADALSRLPLDSTETEETDEVDVQQCTAGMLPVTSEKKSV